jgi:L-aspartate oxidase
VIAFDVLILGSGLAGQSLALRLADKLKVALITKRTLEDSASAWAQGGIAAVLDPADSTEAHVADTHTAGAGLCSDKATRFVVENGPRAIRWLIDHGVPFTPTRPHRSAITSLGKAATASAASSTWPTPPALPYRPR